MEAGAAELAPREADAVDGKAAIATGRAGRTIRLDPTAATIRRASGLEARLGGGEPCHGVEKIGITARRAEARGTVTRMGQDRDAGLVAEGDRARPKARSP